MNWKTGGILKMIASDGIVKGDVNGHIQGHASSTALAQPIQLLIKAPDGVQGTDFNLVYLHVKKHAREFRTVTGGVFHASGGTQRDTVVFKQKKIARYTYEIILPDNFIPGEYAFLAPYSSGGSAGKAYTFHFDKQ